MRITCVFMKFVICCSERISIWTQHEFHFMCNNVICCSDTHVCVLVDVVGFSCAEQYHKAMWIICYVFVKFTLLCCKLLMFVVLNVPVLEHNMNSISCVTTERVSIWTQHEFYFMCNSVICCSETLFVCLWVLVTRFCSCPTRRIRADCRIHIMVVLWWIDVGDKICS